MIDDRNGSERILVFELDIPIRWGDMDAMGHVNNTVYFRYLEAVSYTHLTLPTN